MPDFNEAIKAAAEKLKESEGPDVFQTLEKLSTPGTLGPIIDKLADGLKAFIGYQGGQGIANVIVPLQQLRDGVIKFLYGFLGSVRTLNVDDNGAIMSLGKARMGKETFESTLNKVKGIHQGSANQNKIPEVVKALIDIDKLKQHKDDLSKLSPQVGEYLKKLLQAVNTDGKGQAPSEVDTLKDRFEILLKSYGSHSDFDSKLSQVQSAHATLKSLPRQQPARALVEGITRGTESLLQPLQKTGGYKSSYLSTSNWSGTTDNNKFAKIFLGCLPLYYYWLTYLYWKCKQPSTDGGWVNQRLNGSGGTGLMSFMVGQGFVRDHLNKNNTHGMGSNIAKTALGGFTEFPSAMSTAKSHAEFFQKLRDTGIEQWKQEPSQSPSTTAQTHPLSGLYIVTSTYFGHQQSLNARESRPPTSIREMLYWLAGLQFSPNYYEVQKQIGKHIPDEGLRVADSAKVTPSGSSASVGDTLTRKDFNEYLTSTCLSAPALLGTIQGNSADPKEQNGEPWLHSLFSNSEFKLTYPTSGSAIFYALSQYSYALQFQLSFLYRQCVNGSSDGFGWNQCTFGQHINTQNAGNAANVSSWICSSSACEKANQCLHNSVTCKHYSQCGQTNKQSPLQAFLTDNLKGFYVSQQSDPDSPHHLHNHPPGFMCHVPMGFADKLRRDNAGGANIVYALTPFLSTSNDPLRQLSEKLGCITKRTPRTLGDLFGFLWHLNGQLFKNTRPTIEVLINKIINAFDLSGNLATTFNNDRYSAITSVWKKLSHHTVRSSTSSSGLALSLEAMAPAIPFLYQLFMAEDSNFLPSALFDVRGTTHKTSYHGTHADIFGLYYPECSTPNTNCGPYLSPLTYATGSAFAPKHASSYFSSVLYLADDFEAGLRELLDEFKNIKCSTDRNSTHGSGNCSCNSVAQCAEVLPVLYSNGFNFTSAGMLKGGMQGGDPSKRSCQQFHSQLTAVLAQDESTPLFKLLTTIDDFLYMFRFYFFYNLSSFWIMYVCIVLYTFFFLLDTLRARSHLHFPSSNSIAPISLLGTGKAPALKKFAKLTYFIP
ncbi:variant erythrocyte surface antigen-1 family protein [Babesia caballi]|uniref:Variant erythrocyte surface antigen-1 family protein n=1 Tax=Babesia caballi TaxID=5871 RepID=A0AAV4LWI0_BABCB|nr:variant erythrocyte surface antigen-1 family protein [Babesia caballi]